MHIIERVQKLNQIAPNNGACFGTSDISRLRSSQPVSKPRPQAFKLQRFRGRPRIIKVLTKQKAFAEVRALLGITGRLTAKKFHDAGGKTLHHGNWQLFPKKKVQREPFNPHRAFRQFERMLPGITQATPFPRD